MMPEKAEFQAEAPAGLTARESARPNQPESAESLWLLVLSPTIWAVHFLASYLTAAIWCAKFGDSASSFQGVRLAIGIYTLLALAGITAVARLGHTRHRKRGVVGRSHHADTPLDRHSFLGFATYLLSVLSAVATVFVALAAVFVGSCE